MDLRSKHYIEWISGVALTSGGTVNLEFPLVNSNLIIALVSDCLFLTWGIMTSHAATFTVSGDIVGGVAPADTMLVLPVLAATYTTPYDLPAPMNNKGYIVLTRPWIRLQLADAATANHTYTRFYAKAWW